MKDLISRQDAIRVVKHAWAKGLEPSQYIEILSPAQQWIPFTTRPCTEQEKEEHPDWDCCLDCPLPDDGDEILITTRGGYVTKDEIICDEYGWYLDSGYEIGEDAIAWMPLPEPYKED